MAKIEPGHFAFISIPMGDAKFVTKEGRRRRGGQPPILRRIDINVLFCNKYVGTYTAL